MRFQPPFSTLFTVLFSMTLLTCIAAIFHKIAAITILQFYVINFCDATISTTYICFLHLFAAHLISLTPLLLSPSASRIRCTIAVSTYLFSLRLGAQHSDA